MGGERKQGGARSGTIHRAEACEIAAAPAPADVPETSTEGKVMPNADVRPLRSEIPTHPQPLMSEGHAVTGDGASDQHAEPAPVASPEPAPAAPEPYTLDELRRYLAANSYEFGGWGLDTARWYATVDAYEERIRAAVDALAAGDSEKGTGPRDDGAGQSAVAPVALPNDSAGPRPVPVEREVAPEPCPWCGRKARVQKNEEVTWTAAWVVCDKRPGCEVEGPVAKCATKEEAEREAIALWNRVAGRAALARQREDEELLRDVLDAFDTVRGMLARLAERAR